jgi:sigma-B regulation protein RsbU (phosphoserine phosphatase)
MPNSTPWYHRIFPRLSETQLRILYTVIGVVSLIGIIDVFAFVQSNRFIHTDDCLWEVGPRDGGYALIVTKVIPGGNADVAGVKVEDRVVAINGEALPAVPRDQQNALINRAQQQLEVAPEDRPIPYVVERNGQTIPLLVHVTKQFLFFPFLFPAFAFLWLVIGMTAALAQPRGTVQRQFLFAASTVIFAFTSPPLTILEHPVGWIVGLIWMIAGGLFFLLWLNFCTLFPINQQIFHRRAVRIAIYSMIGFIIAYALLVVLLVRFDVGPPGWVQGIVNIANVLVRSLGYGGGVFFLYRGYRHLPASIDRRPVTAILIGTVLASLALVYIIVMQTAIAGVAILYPQYLLPVLLLLALPISFGYAIFRYQVMDFSRVVRTTLVYAATMALLAGIYLAVGYAVGQALGSLMSTEIRRTVEVVSFVLFVMLLEPVKRQLQNVIENRFFPQRRDYSGRLASYAAEVAEMIGAEAVAERTAMTLQDTLDLRGAVVAIEDPHDGNLRPVARASEFAPVPVSDETVESLRHLLRQSHGLILLETVADPKLEHLQLHFPYVIGLYAQGRVTGAILMSRPHDDENLSGSQISFVSGIAAQAAAALEVARLYEEELARQRYYEELATARRIQESLLPAAMPDIPGISISAVSRPAQAVGGDYYDLIRLSDDRFLVIIADVSGKGLPASLYMAEFHGMVHVACGVYSSPKEILATLNEHLFEVITRGSFITATMLLFDTARRSVSYARAGHTPIIRRGRSEVDSLVPNGVALGLCGQELFAELLQEYTVEYEPGETFILYSDGVSEAMNERRVEFGEGRLHDIIAGTTDPSADALRNRILTQVETFRGDAEQNDDITIVVVRVEKESREHVERERPLREASR